MTLDEFVLVSAPNKAGKLFLAELVKRNVPVIALAACDEEARLLRMLGAQQVILLDPSIANPWVIPEWMISYVYLFEQDLATCCRYVSICRAWTGRAIFVITNCDHIKTIYKGLGADYVIHTNSLNVSFLIPHNTH
ncbi:hypothetical protein ACFSTH_11995 [Paenibacillus yanchengensis]|uniref:Uncharacterized protein n=1 Tax=Paenibacillus yanchengensis TaxID=2035833 RepID=A0ABW4YGE0_9BACL